jgi:hypothetical protein
LLNLFGIGVQPTTADPVELGALYDVSTIALFSAINMFGEIMDCYAEQIVDVILTIIVFIVIVFLVAALTRGFGLAVAVAVAMAIMATPAKAAKSGRGACPNPKVRLQFQESPRCGTNGGTTLNTQGHAIEGKIGVGVTTAEAEAGFNYMLNNTESWIPNAFKPDLRAMTTQVLIKLRNLRPFGVSAGGNIKNVSQQEMYKRTCFRVDVENLVGTNFRE